MRRRDLILYGQTDSNGNFLIANKVEMSAHFKEWPKSFFTIKIEINKTKTASIPLIVYYKKKIVPDMQRAFLENGDRYTQEETDLKLRDLSPITQKENYNTDTRKWERETMELEELDNQQLVFFIEHIKDIAAMELGAYIADPNSLI